MPAENVSLDGRRLRAVANDGGEVSGETVFEFEQDGRRIAATYAGGAVVDGYLTGTLEDGRWDVRYVQINDDLETATGHSVGEVEVLADSRVRVEDEWEWESKPGSGRSVHEEVRE